MPETRLVLTELRGEDLPFLLELWHTRGVMRYADEFPRFRGWTRSDDFKTAWQKYLEKRAQLGNGYTQLILRLEDNTPIGESFLAPLPEGLKLGRWKKPEGVKCLIGDIKLLPAYWGRGLGTEGMRQVVQWAFNNTDCGLLVVPPHRQNPAARRVYEKAGFVMLTERRSWRGHRIMEMTRARYREIYGTGS